MSKPTSKSTPAVRRPDVIAVHSIEKIVFTIPEIEAAEKFYTAFGFDVKRNGHQVDLYTKGHPHCWMSVIANNKPKLLQFISFGIFAQDADAFERRIGAMGIGRSPHPMATQKGLWLESPEGIAIQLVVADKVSPNRKTPKSPNRESARPMASAQMRSQIQKVHPRWLSHALLFTTDVSRMIKFCEEALGLRLSDRSADLVAFTHTPHGSDHHLLAFVQSNGPGLHHTSWDVGSLDEVGEGSEQLRSAGYPDGWGVGRHVLGSNYFYYAKDPWGSCAEYSYDIDFVSPTIDWKSGDFAPEDSFYLWGPAVPEWFVLNTEQAAKENSNPG
jgi:catechol 2,3-dioxygenase-like lactoylglutathione lyase family enzyme